ncbi:hypothetical protein D3C87_2157850 [compost metagenome]
MERGDAATVVTTAALAQAFGQGLDRLALPEIRTIGRDKGTTAFGGGIISL